MNATLELTASCGFRQWKVDQPCRPCSPSLLVRPFVPLHPECHSITQRYNTTLACHSAHTDSQDSLRTHWGCKLDTNATKRLLVSFTQTTRQKFEHSCFFVILTTFYAVDTHWRYQIYVDSCGERIKYVQYPNILGRIYFMEWNNTWLWHFTLFGRVHIVSTCVHMFRESLEWQRMMQIVMKMKEKPLIQKHERKLLTQGWSLTFLNSSTGPVLWDDQQTD